MMFNLTTIFATICQGIDVSVLETELPAIFPMITVIADRIIDRYLRSANTFSTRENFYERTIKCEIYET
jgi:hypothetical protein